MQEGKTFFVAFLITLPIFMGYASGFSLQKSLSFQFGLTEGVSGNRDSTLFGIGVSFVYFFNLLFRVLGHNIVFAWLRPRNRVIAALAAIIVAMTLLAFVATRRCPPYLSVAWVFVSYAFIGMGEGTFGPNMLNIVNHMGDTRDWVVFAMPCGVGAITIVGFGLMALGAPYWCLYIATAALAAIGIGAYLLTIYGAAAANEDGHFDLRQFGRDFKEIANWFPPIAAHSIVFVVNMACLSMFNPGCTLYAYSSRVTFRLVGVTLNHEWFMMMYNIGSFLGDFISRRVMVRRKILHPIWFFLLLCLALALNLSLIPEIAVIAAFGFSWANGGLYCQTTRLISEIFTHKYHLTAISSWMFMGDVGSTTASMLIQVVRPGIAGLRSIMY